MNHPLITPKTVPALRWDILRTTHVGGHLGVTETMMLRTLECEWIGLTRAVLRDQIAYLEARRLVIVRRSEVEDWRLRLDRYGHDVVEYQVECDPGVRRPAYG